MKIVHIGGVVFAREIPERPSRRLQTPDSWALALALPVRVDHHVTRIDRAAKEAGVRDLRGQRTLREHRWGSGG